MGPFAAGTLVTATLFLASGEDALPERFREWLRHDVAAIVSHGEREVFLGLEIDEARERFIDSFWQARDPTPGTRKNEFRDEHERRVAYADSQFGRDGTRPGSRSQRGRIYVLFGEPRDRREFHSSAYGLYPCELWFYQAPKDVGLPPFFSLIFYKPSGVGDFRLYSPLRDGPEALLGAGVLAAVSREHAFSLLSEIDQELFNAAVSLDPGGGGRMESSGMSSELLLSKVQNLPNTMADPRYLRRFAPAEGETRTAISYAQFDLVPLVFTAIEPDDLGWLNYDVLVKPEYLGLNERGSGYRTSFELYVTLSDAQGRTVREAIEELDLDLSKEQAKAAGEVPLAIQGRIAVIPGSYTARFLLRNRATSQFGVGEAKVIVPGREAVAKVAVIGAYLAFQAEPAPPPGAALRPPFEARGLRMFPAREPRFAKGERPWLVAALGYPRPVGPPPKLVKTLSVTRGGEEVFGYLGYLEPNPAFDAGVVSVVEELRLGDGAPGEYQVSLKIASRDGEVLAEVKRSLSVVEGAVARPWAFVREAASTGLRRELARQYLAAGDKPRGAAELTRMAEEEPGAEPRLAAAAMLLQLGEAERAEKALAPLLLEPAPPALARVYAGASLAMRGKYAEAAKHYEQATATTKPGPPLLNALGEAYARSGRAADARRTLERSLEIQPDQPEVRKLLDSLGG